MSTFHARLRASFPFSSGDQGNISEGKRKVKYFKSTSGFNFHRNPHLEVYSGIPWKKE